MKCLRLLGIGASGEAHRGQPVRVELALDPVAVGDSGR